MRDHRHRNPPPATGPDGGADDTSASDTPRPRGQARAKLALLSWAGAYAELLLVLAIGGRAMAGWPLALRPLALSGLMVASVTWVIVPAMTRLFRRWLLR